MQQVVVCPACGANLSLPTAAVEIDGSLSAACPSCAEKFALTADRLTVLPVAQLTRATMERPHDGAPTGVPETIGSPAELADPKPQEANTDLQDGDEPAVAEHATTADEPAPARPTLAELLDQQLRPSDRPPDFDDADSSPPPLAAPSAATAVAADEREPAAAVDSNPLSQDFSFDLRHEAGDAAEEARGFDEAELAESLETEDHLPAPRRRSRLGLQAAIAAAGVVFGLAGGYYLLLLLGGPGRDALRVAAFLPSSLLPASFDAAGPDNPPAEPRPIAPAAGDAVALEEPVADRVDETLAGRSEDPAPKFTPAEPSALSPDASSREAVRASFEAPAATAAGPPEPSRALWSRLIDSPRLGIDRLAAAVEGKQAAATVLRENSLAEPDGLQDVGMAYAELCELAQVVALLDTDDSDPDMMIQRLEAEDLYRRLFRSEHVRADVRQIASRWIAWPGRPHGGVFFSGLPTPTKAVGDGLHEFDFLFDDGSVTKVLCPEPFQLRRFREADEMLIIGSIVDSPRTTIRGYRGDADQVVWRATSIALKLPDLP